MKKVIVVAVAAGCLSACASSSKNIAASYTSPLAYQSYSCAQMHQEASRVSSRLVQVTGEQDQKATGDAVATTVGVILFWPSLFFIKGDGASAAELARLKGEAEAIEKVNIEKKCGIVFQRTPPKKAAEAETAAS